MFNLIDFSAELGKNEKLVDAIKVYKHDLLIKFLNKKDACTVLEIIATNPESIKKAVLLQGYKNAIGHLKNLLKYEQEIASAEIIISANPNLRLLLDDGYYKNDAKNKLIDKIFAGHKFSEFTIKTLHDIFSGPELSFAEVRGLIDTYQKEKTVTVRVPYELSTGQTHKLKTFLAKKFSSPKISLNIFIDTNIKAGFVANQGSLTYDSAIII